MPTATGYSVVSAAREFTLDTELSDPHEIAVAFAETVPEHELRAALAAVLPDTIKRVIHVERQTLVRDVRRGATHSPRWERAAAAARSELLAQRFHANGEWKHLADLTCADVRDIAESYRKRVEENAAWLSRFNRIERLMEAHSAEVVGEIPYPELEEAWAE